MKCLTNWLPIVAAFAIATAASADPSKMTCSLTGKEVSKCCCEVQKDGKMFCTLAKKTVAQCCCKGM